MQKVLVLFKGDFSVFMPEISAAALYSGVGFFFKKQMKNMLMKKHFHG